MTDKFEVFEEQLYDCNWYAWPTAIQQIFMIMVLNAQQPVMIYGYGNVECTRFVFQKVIFPHLISLNGIQRKI